MIQIINLIAIHALAVFILLTPTGWEIANDWKGDYDKARDRVIWSLFAMAASAINFFFVTGKAVFDSFILSWGMHFMVFDYIIAYVHLNKSKVVELPRGSTHTWFTYLGSKGTVDNIGFWRKMNPKVRLIIRGVVLIGCIVIYIVTR